MSTNPSTDQPVEPPTERSDAPTVDTVARAWHAFSDEPADGIAFGSARCTCRAYAKQAKAVVDLFTRPPLPEPEGLGAVVTNPLTGKTWVRAAHPRLPWYDPEAVATDQWTDPTCEDWFIWDALPRPLVVQSTGWVPPPASQPTLPDLLAQGEPTGLGAVVTDANGCRWVRVDAGGDPWLDPASLATGDGREATWTDLVHPVEIRTLGWEQA